MNLRNPFDVNAKTKVYFFPYIPQGHCFYLNARYMKIVGKTSCEVCGSYSKRHRHPDEKNARVNNSVAFDTGIDSI